MRLTKHDKAMMVRAIMNDVPSTDYREKARKLIQDEAYSRMPPLVKAVYDDKSTRDFLLKNQSRYADGIGYIYYYGLDVPASALPDLIGLAKEAEAQRNARKQLEEKLTAMLAPVSTLKQAKVLLPEFEKYMPEEKNSKPLADLPVVNVLTDLTKAGWPKGEGTAKPQSEEVSPDDD